jgi:hypothetical protein
MKKDKDLFDMDFAEIEARVIAAMAEDDKCHYEILANVEIMSDGKTVWINDSNGCNIGRFCRNGIDIHYSGDQQIALGHQCLDCKIGPCTDADWEHFKVGMSKSYAVVISDKHKPHNLVPMTKLSLTGRLPELPPLHKLPSK